MSTVIKTHETITEMLSTVFQPEYRRLGNWIDRLCTQNREAYNDPELLGFIYNGKVYKPLVLNEPNHVIKRRGLHGTLAENMEAYLMDLEVLTNDKAFISQSLFKLLDPCDNDQDIRDALPNCLTDTLSRLQGLTRGRPEAWPIVNDDRAMRQYHKILPRIEMYASARLLY